MQTNFEDIFKTLKDGILNLAETTMKDYVTQATTDGNNVLNSLKSQFPIWEAALVSGDIMLDDLKFLILERKEALQMVALKEIGISQIEVDKFKNGIVDLITNAITAVI